MANVSLTGEHLTLAVDLLSSTTVAAVFYTLVFILYCLSFRLSRAQFRDDQGRISRQTVCTLVFQTALLICATLDVIIKNHVTKVRYIDSALLGGPFGPQVVAKVATLVKLDQAVSYLELILLFGMLLWRVWVVWSGTGLKMPLTVVFLFFYLGVAAFGLSYYVVLWQIGDSSLEATPLVLVILGSALAVFSFASSVFMGVAIIARLLIVRRNHVKVMGKSDIAGQYWGIAAMLIDSYALDTIWLTGTSISVRLENAPSSYFFTNCVIQVAIFTNFLLVYRVLSGRAWTRETQDRISTLRWASNGASTTTPGTVDLGQTNMAEEDPSVICSRNDV